MWLVPAREDRGPADLAFVVWRLAVGALLLLAFLAPSASALSVFDAIQLSKRGYSDQAIIDLIEATDSAFDLEAEDLPKLKKLGVSEPVIRAMLERVLVSDEFDAGPEDPSHEMPGVHEGTPSRPHAEVAAKPDDDFADHALAPRFDGPIRTRAIHETRGGSHVHLALALDGLDVLVLRDEGEFASIESRGQAVVDRLQRAWSAGPGRFWAQHIGSGVRVVFLDRADADMPQLLPILVVSAADARAYALRSGRSVTPDLLARYWADLLYDFWAIAHGEAPERLLALHEGESLMVLREARVRLDEQDATLGAALDLVPSSTRHHLQRLTETVPMEYGQGPH